MPLGLAGFGFEEIIADVGAGYIDVAANALEQPGSEQEVFADFIVGALDALQGANAIDLGERHRGQQAAEPRHQGKQIARARLWAQRGHASSVKLSAFASKLKTISGRTGVARR